MLHSMENTNKITQMATRKDWYQQVENERLPVNEVYETNDGKTMHIEYREENDTIYKTTKTFEKRQCTILPIVAERKKWKKFGDAAYDPPGINSATTKLGDEIRMDFISKIDDETLFVVVSKILGIQCRRCRQGHLTAKCPHKDYLPEIKDQSFQKTTTCQLDKSATAAPLVNNSSANENESGSSIGKCIPPNKRLGDGSKMLSDIRKQDYPTIRVSNLPEETEEQDLRDLFDRYGRITRIYLAKDKITGTPKGFAFVSFNEKREAQIAMDCVNGFGYGHLILKTEWATK